MSPDEPFAPGSPEAEHLRRHCRYLVEDGGLITSGRLVLFGTLNFLVIASLVVWSGVMLGDAAWMASHVLPSSLDSASGIVWLQWLLAGLLLMILALGISRAYRREGRRTFRSTLLRLTWMVAVLALAPAMAARITDTAVLDSPSWLMKEAAWVGIGLAGLVGLTLLAQWAGRRLRTRGAPLLFLSRLGITVLTLRVLQVVFLLGAAWSIGMFFPLFNDHPVLFLVVFVTVLSAPLILQRYVDRASPHHAYRDLLMRCFGIFRADTAKATLLPDVVSTRLSDLAPPPPTDTATFPELLICAAANVSDTGATPAGSNVLSIVFSPSEVTIPSIPEAKMKMRVFERFVRPASFRRWCPAVTFASAVAMTGAAVSPAMGKKTRNNFRALFAALNIRLGVWIPNLLRGAAGPQMAVLGGVPSELLEALARKHEAGVDLKEIRIRPGLDEIVRELFGYHSKSAPLLYVSDGGHYENLGLVELLRRECSEVWCVDASGDRPGRATALAEAILLASGELGVEIAIDLERFSRTDGPAPHFGARLLRHTYAVGTIRYPNGGEGTIVVVKIGLTDRSPLALLEYQRSNRLFPHHPTLNQVFRSDRFDAYRALGWASMTEALADTSIVARLSSSGPTAGGREPAEHTPSRPN